MKRWAAMIAAFLLAGCVPQEILSDDVQANTLGSEELTNQVSGNLPYPISVSKHCPNKQCESYTLVAYQAGLSLTWANSTQEPKQTHLMPHEVKKVRQLVAALHLSRLSTKIIPGHFQCMAYASDQVNYQVIFEKGDFPQRLQIYQGCYQLPEKYQSFIAWFDRKSKFAVNR